jgi:hypothetical protein
VDEPDGTALALEGLIGGLVGGVLQGHHPAPGELGAPHVIRAPFGVSPIFVLLRHLEQDFQVALGDETLGLFVLEEPVAGPALCPEGGRERREAEPVLL